MGRVDDTRANASPGLIEQVTATGNLGLAPEGEEAWIEVIHKMDSVYADLVASQVELEEKNAALEEAHQFIGSVLSSMTDILIVCDLAGNIQQVNSALKTLTGRDETTLIGKPMVSLFAPDMAERVAEFTERLGSHHVVADCEVSLLGIGGEAVPLSVNCSSQYDARGRLIGMVLIGRSIGELRRAYQELDDAHQSLRQAQQQLVFTEKMAALGRLVAGVAHELNNPISFVFGNMHALRRYGEAITTYLSALGAGAGVEEQERLKTELKIDKVMNDILPLVEGTLEGAERVSDIVQDLRRFSSKQSEPKQVFDLPPVLSTAADWVIKSAKRKPEIVHYMPDSLEIFAHKGHIHQIAVNLIQNAIDVMEDTPEPRLDVSCGTEAETVWLSIRDHGPGISPDDLPHIFEPFFTTKPIGDGTGLGLSVSYSMAEEQGGTLTGANHPDGGAIFTLTLPLLSGDGDG
ncbi:MAG: PAS domain-containing protein [Rhodospirillaceae bacterium]|jgi:two-component system, NtrC family, sensor histidine kinase HupT/HoxJ|nr:PAS domain-containing protein [Rhodospirillaceae bacterium]